MKIALVTIHNANNYGAIFQAFALQKVLSRYGDVEIVDYDNRHISRSFDLIRFKPTLHGVLGMGKDLFRVFPRARAIAKFKYFVQENMNLTNRLTQKELLQGGLEPFDVYVAGSDQIWNPACISQEQRIDPVYFLSFAPPGSKRISYASSMGGYVYSEEQSAEVGKYLEQFHAISVREGSAQESLQGITGRDVSHVLDPTLLLSKQEWLGLLGVKKHVSPKEKYILLYTVPKVPLIRHAVEFYSKKLGIKVVSVDQGLSAGAKVNKQIRDAGLGEFIELFEGADLVITDSFHGVCFSLNFGKRFVAVAPQNHANRIESLLALVGLDDRMVRVVDDFPRVDPVMETVDPLERLGHARKKSLDYLVGAFD